MSNALSTPSGRVSRFVFIAAPLSLVLAGTIALWGYYGTAVFYEMIVAGLAACF
jgi:hypothetical protein